MKHFNLALAMLFLQLFPISTYAMEYSSCYWDSTDPVICNEEIDTLKALMVFSVSSGDGYQIDTMKVMLDWTRDFWDLDDSLSMPNYFNKSSYFKHSISGESAPAGDTMFVSSYPVENNAFFISGYYFLDIMEQVDNQYDLREFDITGPSGEPDSIVDMLIFCVCNHTTGGRPILSVIGDMEEDFISEEGIRVDDAHGMVVFFFNRDYEGIAYDQGKLRALRTVQHEYLHKFGIDDTDHLVTSRHPYPGLGGFGFETMYGAQFNGVMGPQNPYWRDHYCKWLNPIILAEPLYSKEIETWDESDSAVYLLQNTLIDSYEKFYITAYDKTTEFDHYWPSPDSGGILIHHIRSNKGWGSNVRAKEVDIELASGLYKWEIDFCPMTKVCKDPEEDPNHLQCWRGIDETAIMYADSVDTEYGLDSLDVRGVCINLWSEYGEGSINTFFDGDNYSDFDANTNPSSHFYNALDSQVVISHLAVKNIYPSNGKMYADLLVNHWYDSLTANTTWGDTTKETGYAITGDFIIPAACTLTVRKGTTIYFQADEDDKAGGANGARCELIVYGTLIAEGDSANRIAFVPSSEQLGTAAVQDWYYCPISTGRSLDNNSIYGTCFREIL